VGEAGYPTPPRNPQTQTTFFRKPKDSIKQKTNTCIDAANAEYYVNGVYVKPQASCLPGSTENQTCKTSRGTTTMRA
jgi:hypothetical protein